MDFSAYNRRWITRLLAFLCLLAICLIFTATPARAGDSERLWPRFAFSVGGFVASSDSTIQLNASDHKQGTNIDFETDLGLGGSESVLTARLDWLMGRRNELSLAWFRIDRNATRDIDDLIEFGDIIYPPGVEVESSLRQTQTELAYTFWALRRDQAGLGISLGVVDVALDAELVARVEAGPYEIELREAASTHAPVPLLGLRGRGLLGDRVVISGDLRFLPNVTIGDYSGDAWSASAGAEWRITDHFGLAASYDIFGIDVDFDDDEWQGSAGLTTSGIRLMGRVLF